MQDDAFEDAIVDFFELADTDKDGVLSYDDFCQASKINSYSY